MEQYLEQISQAVVEGDRDSTVENVQAALDANVDANGGDDTYSAYPLLVQGSKQGIAIVSPAVITAC